MSAYNLFRLQSDSLVPNAELINYQVTNALFSDYADKDRYVYIPDNEKAIMREDGTFDFPTGSMLIKNFYYSRAHLPRLRLMETRLLIRDSSEWRAISYQWDEQGQEAARSSIGAIFPMKIEHGGEALAFDYVIPNKNQCKSCHNADNHIEPIGFTWANLNRTISDKDAATNQLDLLIAMGKVSLTAYKDSLPAMVSYDDESEDLQRRALAYLDINCGHCHRPNGPGNTSGLFLQFNETRSNRLGICKAPVAAGRGSGGYQFDIKPGAAEESILVHRMGSSDPGVMMPEVGRSIVHKEGLELISEWINSLKGQCD